jgi:His/Glu/Gln/Arg/opine family amino acid ABC transporter permease subunit
MTHSIDLPEVLEYAPEPPPRGPKLWLRDHMFSTPASSVFSVIFILIGLGAVRGLLGFVFDPDRRWEAITYNMRLLMVQAYPTEQMGRVWFSVATVAILIAATFALYRIGGRTTPRRFGNRLTTVGGGLMLAGFVGPWGIEFDPIGVASTTGFLSWFGLGLGFALAGQFLRKMYGDEAKDASIPVIGIVGGMLVWVAAVMWTISLPFPARLDDGTQSITFEPIASSTTVPWTVILSLGIVVYVVLALLRSRMAEASAGRVLTAFWVVSFPVLMLVVLRDPELDWNHILTFTLPVALAFIVVGGLILNFVANSKGELGRVIGALLLILAFVSFLVSAEFAVRWSMLALAMFALAAPTFGGQGSGRRVFLGVWAGTITATVYFITTLAAPSTVDIAGNGSPFGGLLLTILLSTVAIVVSFPLGIILALGRTSKMPIFRLMSTAYIEFIRGVPLITWLIVAFVMLPVALPEGIAIGGVARAIGAMTLFSAAYLAENVRGGLQAIPKGQYEAAQAMGLTTMQTTVFIVLPQALRAVIPALVGQVIALFKDTSLVTIVGLFDFLHIARVIIPGQSQPFNFIGVLREPLVFVAVVYWMFTFTFSRISQRLEKKLGVGER